MLNVIEVDFGRRVRRCPGCGYIMSQEAIQAINFMHCPWCDDVEIVDFVWVPRRKPSVVPRYDDVS